MLPGPRAAPAPAPQWPAFPVSPRPRPRPAVQGHLSDPSLPLAAVPPPAVTAAATSAESTRDTGGKATGSARSRATGGRRLGEAPCAWVRGSGSRLDGRLGQRLPARGTGGVGAAPAPGSRGAGCLVPLSPNVAQDGDPRVVKGGLPGLSAGARPVRGRKARPQAAAGDGLGWKGQAGPSSRGSGALGLR